MWKLRDQGLLGHMPDRALGNSERCVEMAVVLHSSAVVVVRAIITRDCHWLLLLIVLQNAFLHNPYLSSKVRSFGPSNRSSYHTLSLRRVIQGNLHSLVRLTSHPLNKIRLKMCEQIYKNKTVYTVYIKVCQKHLSLNIMVCSMHGNCLPCLYSSFTDTAEL